MPKWTIRRGTLEREVADTAALLRLTQEKRLRPTDEVFHPLVGQWMSACAVSELAHAFGKDSSQHADASTMDPPPDEQRLSAVISRASDVEDRDFAPESPLNVGIAAEPSDVPRHDPRGTAQITSQPAGEQPGIGAAVVRASGGVVAMWGGITLIGLRAAAENSMIEAIAHGIGFYCLGKGIFMIGAAGDWARMRALLNRRVS